MPKWDHLGEHMNEPTTMHKILKVLDEAEGMLPSGEICARAGFFTYHEKQRGNRALRRLHEKGMLIRRSERWPMPTPWGWDTPMKRYVYLIKEDYRERR